LLKMFIVVIHVTRDENTGNLKPNCIWIELAYNNAHGQHNQHHFLKLHINESWPSKFKPERNIIVIKSDGSDIYMKGEHEADKFFKMDYIRDLEITLYAESLQSIQNLQNEIASKRREKPQGKIPSNNDLKKEIINKN